MTARKYFKLNMIVLEMDKAALDVVSKHNLDDDEFEWIYAKFNLSMAHTLLRFKREVI